MPPADAPPCSVVIPCHNGVALTRACLESLLSQSRPPAQIVVVDNASSDGTDQLGELHPSIRVVRAGDNLGFAGGVNLGIAACQNLPGTVLIVNNDTQAADNLLEELHRALFSAADIGAAAPASNHVKGEARLPVGDTGRDADGRRELAAALAAAPLLQDVDTLAGLCLLLRHETLAEIGPFDERFGHGNFEDDDYSLRLRLAGYRLVIARRAFLHHEGHATFRSLGLDLDEQLATRGAQFRSKWQHHPAGLATLALLHSQPELAARAADEARRHLPQWPDADRIIGQALANEGDYAGAIRHLRAFVRRCPAHIGAHLKLGIALTRSGRAADGRALLIDTITRLAPNPAETLDLLVAIGGDDYHIGAYHNAREAFAQALEIAPQRADLHHWYGLCALALDDLDAAERAFRVAVDGDVPRALGNLGICLHRRGARSEASACFERAYVLTPDDPIARRNYDADRAQRSAPVAT